MYGISFGRNFNMKNNPEGDGLKAINNAEL